MRLEQRRLWVTELYSSHNEVLGKSCGALAFGGDDWKLPIVELYLLLIQTSDIEIEAQVIPEIGRGEKKGIRSALTKASRRRRISA